MMNDLDRFEMLFNRLSRLKRPKSFDVLQAEYDEGERRMFKEWFPRRKFKRLLLLGRPLWAEYNERLRKRAEALGAKRDKCVGLIEKRLRELAEGIDLESAEGEPRLCEEVWVGTYYSTGRGEYYARANAQGYLEHARSYRVQGELRQKYWEEGGPKYYGVRSWQVWLQVSEVGVEVLKRKQGQTVREFVRRCWAKGVNPRVYYPGLRPGYEEQVGLDYFGHDLKLEHRP